ncbi:MAG: hypothetical protein FWE19_00575 [Oscillospiraceae bacterium]|nr:hypothetical protein [Oscillospiraceae bacterium]
MPLYLIEKFKQERETEHRDNYNSAMLYMIAQPTRKNPKSVPMYKPLFADPAIKEKKKETAEDLLRSFLDPKF